MQTMSHRIYIHVKHVAEYADSQNDVRVKYRNMENCSRGTLQGECYQWE